VPLDPQLTWAGALYVASEWVIRIAMLFYVPQKRTPAAARTWLLFIFLVPWAGLAFYALVGRIYLPKRRLRLAARAQPLVAEMRASLAPVSFDAAAAVPPNFAGAVRLADAVSVFPVCGGNRLELLADYEQGIGRLVDDIRAAQRSIHLLYYIFADDEVGRAVGQALAAAVQRGVSVRLLMDSMGSRPSFRRLVPELRAQGIEVVELLRPGLFNRNSARFDLRNHRKIAVIDGRIGYTGSQNIVSAHANAGLTNEELVVRCEGPVVQQLHAVLLADRMFEGCPPVGDATLFAPPVSAGPSPAQVVPTGPGYLEPDIEQVMVSLIYGAARRIVLVSPYFIPDTVFLRAIRLAARRGVEVNLVVSRRSNKRVVQFAQESFYDELLDAGVRIHLYRGFLHAKHHTFDDDIALAGSSNLDIRSFALNQEVSVLVYDRSVVADFLRLQERYMAGSDLLDAHDWRQRPQWRRLLQNVSRLTDSFL